MTMRGGGSRVPTTLSATSGPSSSAVAPLSKWLTDIAVQRASGRALGALDLLGSTLLFECLGRLALLLSLLIHALAHVHLLRQFAPTIGSRRGEYAAIFA